MNVVNVIMATNKVQCRCISKAYGPFAMIVMGGEFHDEFLGHCLNLDLDEYALLGTSVLMSATNCYCTAYYCTEAKSRDAEARKCLLLLD